MIKAQDAPDILLIQPNPDHDAKEKPFKAVSLEIMQIPEIQKQKFGQDIESETATFIHDKKFTKRYAGIPHLLVHLNFDHVGFNMIKLSEYMQKIGGGPFHQIWIRVNADPQSRIMKVVQIYPTYAEAELDFLNDRDLQY